MGNSILTDQAFNTLTYALDGLSMRQQVLTNDIANANTPGFRAQDVSFESQLQNLIASGSSTNLSSVSPSQMPSVVTLPDTGLGIDQNNVNIDSTMSRLADTTLMYQAVSQLAADKLSLMKTVITGAH